MIPTSSQLAENSHPGFQPKKRASHQASSQVNSSTASGIALSLRQNGIGSRCSGKERDNESGNDFFENRYYANMFGRFLTPDLSGQNENVKDPQSWNRYAYTENDPINFNDPDGLARCGDTEIYDGTEYKTLDELFNQDTDLGILASAIFAEAEEGNSADHQSEKWAIADVIINRHQIVNGVINVAGLNPSTLGYKNSGFAGIVGYPGQFDTFEATSAGDHSAKLKAAPAARLRNSLNSSTDKISCLNAMSSWSIAFAAFNIFRSDGFKFIPRGDHILTSFNSFTEKPGRSLPDFEDPDYVLNFGTRNQFYGIKMENLRVNQTPSVVYATKRNTD